MLLLKKVALPPPQILYGLPRKLIRSSAARSPQLSVWKMQGHQEKYSRTRL